MAFHDTKILREHFLVVEVLQDKDGLLETSKTSETKAVNGTCHDPPHFRNGDPHRTEGSHEAAESSPFTTLYVIVTKSNGHLFILNAVLISKFEIMRNK
jgi:hypothetical protein